MAEAEKKSVKSDKKKPNFFEYIGLFIKQVIMQLKKTVAPNRHELLVWTVAVFVFVVILMLCVTAIDFGLGKLTILVFG